MEWKKTIEKWPEIGDEKISRFFAWRPIRIGDTVKFLKFVTVKYRWERFMSPEVGGMYEDWFAISFVQ